MSDSLLAQINNKVSFLVAQKIKENGLTATANVDFFVDMFDRYNSGELNGYWLGRLSDFAIADGSMKGINSALTDDAIVSKVNVKHKNYTVKSRVSPPNLLPSRAENQVQPYLDFVSVFKISVSGIFMQNETTATPVREGATIVIDVQQAFGLKRSQAVSLAAQCAAKAAAAAAADDVVGAASSAKSAAIHAAVAAAIAAGADGGGGAAYSAAYSAAIAAYNVNSIINAATDVAAITRVVITTSLQSVTGDEFERQISAPLDIVINVDDTGTVEFNCDSNTTTLSGVEVIRSCYQVGIHAVGANRNIDSIKVFGSSIPEPPDETCYGYYDSTLSGGLNYVFADKYHIKNKNATGNLISYTYSPNEE